MREDIHPIIDMISKSGCLGRNLSYDGKLILLTTGTAITPTYRMSMTKFSEWTIEVITTWMSQFFWGNFGDEHKYHLANWELSPRRI